MVDTKRIANLYKDRNIVLNTIDCSGIELWRNKRLLTLVSQTGGMNYQIPEMNQLAGTFSKILSGSHQNRMLLDYRVGFDYNSGFYAFLRIFFIALIGLAIAFACGYMMYNSDVIKKLFIQKIITGILAGVILEFCLSQFWPAAVVRLIMALLLGVMFTFFRSGFSGNSSKYDRNNALNNDSNW